MAGRMRRVIAYHEAGHAVIARKLGLDTPHATARWKDPIAHSELAYFLAAHLDTSARIAACEKDAIVALAGYAAQRREYPQTTPDLDTDIIKVDDDEDDMLNARTAVYRIVCLNTGQLFPDTAATVRIDIPTQEKMRKVFIGLKQQTAALVETHWSAIARVAKALERNDSIDQAELDRLIAVAEHRYASA